MYSGHISLDGDENKHYFYWFIRHRDESPENPKPLALWINGGPGASGMYGLFLENGPLRLVEVNGKTKLHTLDNSWTEEANIIFLDQPVNVGYSYADDYVTTEDEIKTDFLAFMQGFY